jgi:phage terminase large subunit-like protein
VIVSPSIESQLESIVGKDEVKKIDKKAETKKETNKSNSVLTETLNKLANKRDNFVEVMRDLLPQYYMGLEPSPIHYELGNLLINRDDSLALNFPRDFGKTTNVSEFLFFWNHIFRKYNFIVYISVNETKASARLRNAVAEIKTHPISKRLIKKIHTDNSTMFECETKDGEMYCIKAFGAGGSLRGERYKNFRPDIIIVDDIEDPKDAMSKVTRENLRSWFFSDVVPMTHTGRIFVVGTIVHEDSLLNNLLNNPPEYPHKFTSLRYSLLNEDGTAVWDAKFPLEKIENMKQDAIKQGTLDLFYMEYMGIAISPENQRFKREYFKYISEYEFDKIKGGLNYFTTIDLASSTGSNSDFTAIVTVGVNSENHWFIVDITSGRWDSSDKIKKIFEVYRKFKPMRIGIERGIIFKEMEPYMNMEMAKTNTFFLFEELNPYRGKMSKFERIEASLQPRYKNGFVWHVGVRCGSLEDELLLFPKSRHDDKMDALSYISDIAFAPTDSNGYVNEFGVSYNAIEYNSPYIV